MKLSLAIKMGVAVIALSASLSLGGKSNNSSNLSTKSEGKTTVQSTTPTTPPESQNSKQAHELAFKKLLRKWTLKFKFKGTFEEAIYKFQKVGDIVIYVDWVELKECGIKRKSKVRFRNTGKRFGDLLEIFLTRSSRQNKEALGYYYQNGFLVITSNEKMLEYRRRHQPKKPPLVIPKLKRSSDKDQPIPDVRDGQPDKEEPQFEQNVDPENLRRFGKIKFDKITLKDLIDHLRKETELNFHPHWKALAKSNIKKNSKISITGNNLTLAQLLDLAFADLNVGKDKFEKMYWIVDNNIIRISTGKDFNNTLRTKIFDVTQLLQPKVDNAEFTIGRAQAYIAGYEPIVSSNAVAYKPIIGYAFSGVRLRNYDDDPPPPGKSKRQQLREELIETVKNCLPEDMWRPLGSGSINIFRKKLVVTQTLLGWKLMQK